MDFALTPDQEMIRDTAESFLAEASPSAAVRRAVAAGGAYDPALWRRIGGELGWCATAIPETDGGLGLSAVELALLTEQMGRRLLCSPFFSTACLATNVLIEAADPDARRRLLSEIAAGDLAATAALAVSGLDWRDDAPLCRYAMTDFGYVLDGCCRHVPDGATADLLLIPARSAADGPVALFAVPAGSAGVAITPLTTIDATRPLAEVRFERVSLPASALFSPAGGCADGMARAAARAAIALAAEQLGGAQQCLDLTLAYIGERKQFGRSIASFQAVKHRCAEMMVRIEALRSLVYGAACVAAAAPATDVMRAEAAAAKSLANDTFFHCAAEAIQLHGGVGFTWEYDPQLYFKRAQTASHWFGDTAVWQARIAAMLLG